MHLKLAISAFFYLCPLDWFLSKKKGRRRKKKRRVQNGAERLQLERDESKHKRTELQLVQFQAEQKTKYEEKDSCCFRRMRASTVKAGKLNCE